MGVVVREQMGGGGLDDAGEGIGQRHGGELAVGKLGNAGDHKPSHGDLLAGAGLDSGHADLVGDGPCALFGDEQVELDEVLEAERAAIVAGGVDSWKADGRMSPGHDDGVTDGAQERMLHRLHVTEELGEMDDPGHVGLVELDEAGGLELEGHGGRGLGGRRLATRAKEDDLLVGSLDLHGMGLDVGIVLEGLVDDAAVVGVHGLELDDVAPAPDLLGALAGALDELLAGLASIAPDVEDDAGRGVVAAMDDAVEEVLQVAKRCTLPADEAAWVVRLDVEHELALEVDLLDLGVVEAEALEHLEEHLLRGEHVGVSFGVHGEGHPGMAVRWLV